MKRDWSLARAKVEQEGQCRVCGTTNRLEAAHVIAREHDLKSAAFVFPDGPPKSADNPIRVHPVRIVPLCGPATDTTTCHGKYDAHRLDLLPRLTRLEQVQAVADVGIERARKRITGSPSDG